MRIPAQKARDWVCQARAHSVDLDDLVVAQALLVAEGAVLVGVQALPAAEASVVPVVSGGLSPDAPDSRVEMAEPQAE
jgi:hypothetical protein